MPAGEDPPQALLFLLLRLNFPHCFRGPPDVGAAFPPIPQLHSPATDSCSWTGTCLLWNLACEHPPGLSLPLRGRTCSVPRVWLTWIRVVGWKDTGQLKPNRKGLGAAMDVQMDCGLRKRSHSSFCTPPPSCESHSLLPCGGRGRGKGTQPHTASLLISQKTQYCRPQV